MSDPAQSRSQLLSKMRGAFTQSSSISDTTVSQMPMQNAQPQQSPQQLPQQVPQQNPVLLSTSQKLDILDSVLADFEPQLDAQVPPPQVNPQQPIQTRQQNMGMIAQATPAAVDQAVYQQQQTQAALAGSGAKETLAGGSVDTVTSAEVGAAIQYVEHEPSPEISPEVAEYLEHVKDHTGEVPQEIVVGEEQQQTPLATNYQKQAVVVLPITPEIEKTGEKKRPLESIRWLVEWSRKLIKMFSGTIIYRETK